MKTIVISGAHSNVGKSALAKRLSSILHDSVHVKIGHGRVKKGMSNLFYPEGTPFGEIAAECGGRSYLIIESNRVLREIAPDLVIFLTGGFPKPTAIEARFQADIIRGETVVGGKIEEIGARLGLGNETVLEIVKLAGAFAEIEREG